MDPSLLTHQGSPPCHGSPEPGCTERETYKESGRTGHLRKPFLNVYQASLLLSLLPRQGGFWSTSGCAGSLERTKQAFRIQLIHPRGWTQTSFDGFPLAPLSSLFTWTWRKEITGVPTPPCSPPGSIYTHTSPLWGWDPGSVYPLHRDAGKIAKSYRACCAARAGRICWQVLLLATGSSSPSPKQPTEQERGRSWRHPILQ